MEQEPGRHIICLPSRRPGILAALLFLIGLARGAWAASDDHGQPPVVRLSPTSSGFLETCLSSDHAPNGNVMVGSEEGMLEYDGWSWRLVRTPGRTLVRSVKVLPDGSVAYGAVNEFGIFRPNEERDWTAWQLSDSLKGRVPHFREVRGIFNLSHGLYFQCRQFLARWRDGRLQLYQPAGVIGAAAALGDTLFLQVAGKGLLRLHPEELETHSLRIPDRALSTILGPALFDDDNRLVCLLQSEMGILLGTRTGGIHLLNGRTSTPMPVVSDLVQPHGLYGGLNLADGRLVLSTLQGGLFLLDGHGRLLQHLDSRNGLTDPMVIHVSQDRAGDLWVANLEGLSRVGLSVPYTVFGKDQGLDGRIQCITRHRGRLYVGTTKGVFRLQEGGVGQPARFDMLPGHGGICWEMLSTPSSLLAIIGGQLREVGEPGAVIPVPGQPNVLLLDERDPGRVLVSLDSHMHVLARAGGRWQVDLVIPGMQGVMNSMVQLAGGVFWLASDDAGLFRVQGEPGAWNVDQYTQAGGLAPGACRVARVHGGVLVSTGAGLMEPDSRGVLRRSTRVAIPPGYENNQIVRLKETPDHIWCLFREGLAHAGSAPGQEIEWKMLMPAAKDESVGPLLVEGDQVWLAVGRYLRHLDDSIRNVIDRPVQEPPVQIRSLVLGGREWAGSAGGLKEPGRISGGGPLDLRVACAGLGLDKTLSWSWRVVGLDEEWSPWTRENRLSLARLEGGDYRIQVRVQAGKGPAREETLAEIHVPRPWYMAWWVRVLAPLALVLLANQLGRRRARGLKRLNLALEAEVLERRRAESALQSSETRYRGLFDHALDGIIIMDSECFLKVNPSLCRIFRRTAQELVGHSPAEFSPPLQPDGRSSAEAARQVLEATMRGETRAFEWTHLAPDGSLIFTEVSLSPLDLGDTRLVLAVLRDISQRCTLEEQLRQSQKMEAVGRLAGGVAHDFNNILTVILGQCDMLLMSLDARDPIRDELLQVRDAALRAAQLTRQLLAFSRKQTLHPQQISVNTVLRDLEKMLRRVIGEDIEIHMDLAPDLMRVNVDPGQLDQVILNLAVNSRDAMGAGGALWLGTRNVMLGPAQARELGATREGAHVQLSIRDTGHGMSQDVLNHIFEPFYTTKEPGKGTGLGLATVYGIITQSEGVIHAASQAGQGATFEIHLPATEGSVEKVHGASPVNLSSLGGREQVLLVEDEDAVRDVLQRTLKHHGYEVATAEDGVRALGLLGDGMRPDLVLSDVIMPHMGGFDLARELRRQGLRPPIILMTGYTDRDMDANVLKDLDATVLVKPFGPGALLGEIRRRLDLS